MVNPDPDDSDWQPDSSFFPDGRQGPKGSADQTSPYPTMVLEVATSETDDHVKAKAAKYLIPRTTIQIVIVLLIRPKEHGADCLKMLKYERGQMVNPCWECSIGSPACTVPGDPSFKLLLPVKLLFDNVPIPLTLTGKTHVEAGPISLEKEISVVKFSI